MFHAKSCCYSGKYLFRNAERTLKKKLTSGEDRRDRVRYHLSRSYQYYDDHNAENKRLHFLISVEIANI